MHKGIFITFEGVDGSGKSTQAKEIANTLNKNGYTTVLTREPGGSIGAELIRKLLVEGDPDRWSPETEMLLFTAARRDHFEKTINLFRGPFPRPITSVIILDQELEISSVGDLILSEEKNLKIVDVSWIMPLT